VIGWGVESGGRMVEGGGCRGRGWKAEDGGRRVEDVGERVKSGV
jgi:hypothetical protein